MWGMFSFPCCMQQRQVETIREVLESVLCFCDLWCWPEPGKKTNAWGVCFPLSALKACAAQAGREDGSIQVLFCQTNLLAPLLCLKMVVTQNPAYVCCRNGEQWLILFVLKILWTSQSSSQLCIKAKVWLEGGVGTWSSDWSQQELQMLYVTNQNLPVSSAISFWFEKYLGLVRIVLLKGGGKKNPKPYNLNIPPPCNLVFLWRTYGKSCGSMRGEWQQVGVFPQKWKPAFVGYLAEESTCF